MSTGFGAGPGKSSEELADELVGRWLPLFKERDWENRLELLHLVLEQLQDDVADLTSYAAISPVFIGKLIDQLPTEPIRSRAQAHIFANSNRESHRLAAGRWLANQKRTERSES
jgi:hypothetical protein